MMAYVYRHIRLDTNEPFYIGIGSDTDGIYTRAFSKSRNNQYWHNIINKTSYEVEILMDDLTWEEACKKEIEFIKLYGRKNLNTGILVNLTDGGEGGHGRFLNYESRHKISVKSIGRRASVETKKKMSNSHKGKIISKITRKKLSDSLKNKIVTAETRLKMSLAASGRAKTRVICDRCGKNVTSNTILQHQQGKQCCN